MIEVAHLSKSYGTFKAVDDISFRVEPGEVVGFLGPNGAGKSTTLRILAGFLGASSGRVTIGGLDIAESPLEARAKIGYMPESSPLYPEMRVAEYLRFRAELKRVPRKEREDAVKRALADARIEDVRDITIGHLSKGYRQRVGLADALVASPPLLILDEPTAGLDPNQIREVRDLIKRLGKEHTVFVSTHILSEVEATCSRAIVIARGKLVAEGPIEALRARGGAVEATLTLRGEPDALEAAVKAHDGVARVTRVALEVGDPVASSELILHVKLTADAETNAVLESLVATLVGAGFGVRGVEAKSSLESVFSELTTVAKDDAKKPSAATTPSKKKREKKA